MLHVHRKTRRASLTCAELPWFSMASIATRIMASLGDIKISRLIMPTVIVVVLVLVVRWATAPPKPLGAVMEKIDKEHLFEVST